MVKRKLPMRPEKRLTAVALERTHRVRALLPLLIAAAAIVPRPKCFVGWYADFSGFQPGRDYSLAVDLPQLKPGQFQVVFFDNVEPEYTRSLVSM